MKKLLSIFFALTLALFTTSCNVGGSGSTGIVVVGMGVSGRYGKCPGADVDAVTMNRILSNYGKPTVLVNQQATKAAVVNALKEAAKKDLMIFFYSGHGGQERVGDLSGEPDLKNEHLCLYNTYMLDNEIWEIVKGAKGRVVLIFDCCHSETMFRDPGIDLSEVITEEEMARSGDNVRMLCWSGCPDSSYSYGDNNGGILTNAIRDAWKKGSSYKNVWGRASKTAKSQNPRKTVIGKSFESEKVFQ